MAVFTVTLDCRARRCRDTPRASDTSLEWKSPRTSLPTRGMWCWSWETGGPFSATGAQGKRRVTGFCWPLYSPTSESNFCL